LEQKVTGWVRQDMGVDKAEERLGQALAGGKQMSTEHLH
jgi:hypothetical protein